MKKRIRNNYMKRLPRNKIILATALIGLVLFCFPIYANIRVMSYNIRDFWLRFDGEPGSITDQGAKLDKDDLEKLEVIADVINKKKPDVIGILECASLAELLFFNERFLQGRYRCWSFRAYDSRTFGIPLGLMVKKNLQVKSVDLVSPKIFSARGVLIADIAKDEYEFTLILVHLKSKIERRLGESALKRDIQGTRLHEIVKEKLEEDPNVNIIICGDFNDLPGRDRQEKAANVEDLIAKMSKPIRLKDGTTVRMYNVTLMHKDKDINGKLWTEKSRRYPPVLFDYFFLTEGAHNEFLSLDHIYPEEFANILGVSDHIPVVLDLGDE